MEIEYYNGSTKHKDEGIVIRFKTDSGFVKAVCPKNPLAWWVVAYGKNIVPVFHLNTLEMKGRLLLSVSYYMT